MIPGASKAMKDVEIEDDAFKHIEAIIHSMTPIERSKPALIDVKEGKNTRVLEPKLSK
jgi:signal recognition particle subunit SRP54